MDFEGNTHDLGSFEEETDKIADLHQISQRIMQTVARDNVTRIKRRHRDQSCDDVKNMVMASGPGRLKEDLESSTRRQRQDCKATPSGRHLYKYKSVFRVLVCTIFSLCYLFRNTFSSTTMGDANPICTFEDYSKPSHEGYKNIIELSVGNNMVPLRFDTIRLVQNRRSFHGLRSEDPNQHLNDFLELMDSLDLDDENRERTCMQELAQYKDEGWNNASIPSEERLNYKNIDIKQLLGIMKSKVNTLMKDAISLMGRSKGVFRMTTNKMCQPSPEPSRQEEFEHIVMNFILDQEERIEQLKEYMKVLISDFMQLSSKVTMRLKDKIRKEGGRLRKIKKITKYPNMEISKPLAGHKFPETLAKKSSTIPSNLSSRTHYG
nr:MAK10-like protein [Tanacetum cinerariifolium]